ncbi:MAG TPA: permease [Anaerolineae bacterium]
MNDLINIIDFVIRAVLHALPFFLISISLSVLVRSLQLEGTIRRAFAGKVGVAIVLATLVGAFSPFCSCTVVPVVAGLLASGVPLAPVMSFWIASPTMDPEILALSAGILGWPLALTRLGTTLLLSLAAGYVTLALSRTALLEGGRVKSGRVETVETCCTPQPLSIPFGQPVLVASGAAGTATACGTTSCSVGVPRPAPQWQMELISSLKQIQWPDFGRKVAQECWRWGRWLLLAFVLEALIVRYVPQAAIAAILGDSSNFAVPLAALVGIPLYLTEISTLPIVSGLLDQGMQPGAAIALLIAGPVTTLPAMTAVWGMVRRRVFVLYLSIGLLGAVVMGMVANVLLT